MSGFFALQSAIDPEIALLLQRLAFAQTFMAFAIGVMLLLVIGGALMSYRTLRSAARLLRASEKIMEEMVPRLDPLIEKATRIADDANDVTDSLRRKVHEATTTLEEVNLSMRRGTREAERRVREFAAVIEVVQEEAESLLLDAAAAARGVQTTASTLHERRPHRAGTRRAVDLGVPVVPVRPDLEKEDPDGP